MQWLQEELGAKKSVGIASRLLLLSVLCVSVTVPLLRVPSVLCSEGVSSFGNVLVVNM